MKIALTSDTHYGHNDKTHRVHEKFLQKLASEDFDLLVHCGDWISNSQHQLPRTLRMFRRAINDRPILTVIGNHDLWDSCNWWKKKNMPNIKKSYRAMVMDHHDWMASNNIHHLAWNPYKYKDECMFYGFDGWYSQLPVDTNDKNFMPGLVDGSAPIDLFLANEAHKALDSILEKRTKLKIDNPHLKTVCCTHHPPYCFQPEWQFMCANPSFMSHITENFDYLLVGHSHKKESWEKNDCKIFNSGSDYNLPKYVIIDTL